MVFTGLVPVRLGQHKGQLRRGGALAVHIGGSLAHSHRSVLFQQLTVQGQHISGSHLFAEPGVLDAPKERQLAPVLRQGQCRHRTGLRQCFQDQHPWHDRLAREVTAEETIQHMNGGYDIIPSNIMLAGAEQELSQTGKEHRLKEAIASVADNYDYMVVDTPPSLGVLTVNAFTAATDILIPTTAGIFATTGINQLNETVKSVQKYCNPNVKITGILFTRFNPRANISKQIKELTEQLSKYISAPIYKTYIRSAVAVEEAQANRTDIFDYAEKSTVSEDYKAFIEEFLKGEQE